MKRVRPHAVVTVVLSLGVAGLVAALFAPPRLLSLNDDGEERGETFGTDALRYQMLRLSDRFGRIPQNAHWRAKQHVDLLESAGEAHRVEQHAPALLSPDLFAGAANTSTASTGSVSGSAAVSSKSWRWLGPGNVGGRVRSIAVNPSNHNVLFAGSVGGGIWKTTNAGASWSPVNDFMAALSVASIVIDPANASVMYAGTGEGYSNGDAIMGAGILESTDGGTTWTQLPSTASAPAFQTVNRLSMSIDGRVLLAATGGGIFRSVDAGSSFTRVGTSGTVYDVDASPIDAAQAIAGAQGRVWYSRDAGVTWTAATGLPAGAGRIETAYAKTQPGVVYASVDYAGGILYRSVDGGATFSATAGTNLLGNQGWYSNALWVSPVDGNHVIVGGLYLQESTDAGTTWHDLSYPIHVDQHVIVSDPGYDGSANATLYFGNDGGVFRADTGGFKSLNNNLGVTQFYSGAGNASSGVIVGGTQDNGTLLWQPGWGTSWTQPIAGDGGYTASDSGNASYFYAETIYLSLYRSTTGGSGFTYIGGGISDAGAQANFIAPFVLDPNNPQRIFAGGASVWRSDDVKASVPAWKAVKSAATGTDYVSALAVAPGNSDILWVGHSYGRVFKSTNATASTPSFTTISAPTNGMVTRIAIDPSNWNIVYVTTGGFGATNVLKTTDGGASWTDATGSGTTGLPDAPVYDLKIDPNTPSTIYAATQVGVFASTDGGAHWELPQDGPANVSVDELFWMGSTLVAATHGRGMFAVDTAGAGAPAVAIAPRSIDYGSQSLGSATAARTVTITNSGSAPLTVTSFALTGSQAADFAWSGTDTCTGATVSPGASCTRAVAFKPTAAGTRSATLLVYTNAPTSPTAITISGTGLGASSSSSLPSPWRGQDIGAVGAAGGASYASGTFTVSGAGADIWGSSDAVHFVYQPLSGDGEIVARVATVQALNAWTKAGVMIRETASASSAHAALIVSPSKGLAFQYRAASGGMTTNVAAAGTAPRWIRIARAGSTFTASTSTDGSTWTTVGRATISMATSVSVGIVVSSHVAGQLATATFDHVTATAAAHLPAGWSTRDIGAVGPSGSAAESSGTFTVKGGGADVWGTADAFRYAYVQLAGDGSIAARVATVQNVAGWTKAGVMIRQTLDPGSMHASMLVSAAKGLAFQRRKAAGGTSVSTAATGAAPEWVKLTRKGQGITASVSTDGVTWTTVATDTVPFSGAVWAGLAVSSHDATQLAAATFDHVAAADASSLPSGWSASDIGAVGVPGASSASNGVFTIKGAGSDIWGVADAFRYTYRTLTGDGQLVARVASVQNTNRWAKAGVMIRQSASASAPQAIMLVSAAAGTAFQYRAAAGGASANLTGTTTAIAPQWVKIVRAGNAVSGYQSADGVSWTLVGSATIPMSASVDIGFAVSSHNSTATCAATFDHVTP